METLSATDKAIVAVLRADARISVTDLAAKVGVSRTTARARLEALISDGVIRRFTIETDTFGEDSVRAITLVQLQGKMSRQVVRTIRRIPEVSDLYETNGTWDLVVTITAASLMEFNSALRAIREVPGVINSESCLLLAHATG